MGRKICGIVIALLGLVSLGFGFDWIGQEVLLDATGKSTPGVVTEKSTSEDEDHHPSYYLSYRYEDSNGQSHTSRSDVFESMFDTHPEGSSIPVTYSSSFPSVSRIRSAGEYLLPGGILLGIGGLMLWIGIRLVLKQIYWDQKSARLLANGERRIGRLVAVEEDPSEQSEDTTPLVLVYTFTDKAGQERTGKTFHIAPRDHEFWKGRIGCPLDVRVNPADPEDHLALVEESKGLN